jgi:hypothetical protein
MGNQRRNFVVAPRAGLEPATKAGVAPFSVQPRLTARGGTNKKTACSPAAQNKSWTVPRTSQGGFCPVSGSRLYAA